ncbi:MAG: winged helix-turn-helix domain-containing protein [Kiloniellales bacterium]|nr:winged helix-turn-helix domain-containing protein [Kiloniellales bacterium]
MERSLSKADDGRSGRTEDTEIVLGLLSAIEENKDVTQRSLARETNIALGLANAYLKRLIRKGFVKVQQVPLNRYSYYLTPKGFTEKARLTTLYLSGSLYFFRQARRQCSELFAHCAVKGWRRVALAGAGDLAEIATLCTNDQVAVTAIVDPGRAGETFAHLPVVEDVPSAGEIDAVLVTDLSHPQACYDALLSSLPAERVLAPALLRIGASAQREAEQRQDAEVVPLRSR